MYDVHNVHGCVWDTCFILSRVSGVLTLDLQLRFPPQIFSGQSLVGLFLLIWIADYPILRFQICTSRFASAVGTKVVDCVQR